MTFTAGQRLTAASLNSSAEIGQYIAEHKPTAAVTSSGTTEKVVCNITTTLTAGAKYEVYWQGDMSLNTGSGSGIYRLRWKLTSTVDTTGTEFSTRDSACNATANFPATNVGTFTAASSGTHVVVATAQSSGNNIIQAYGAGAHIPLLLIKRIL